MLSEYTIFVRERITDILKLEGDKKVEISEDVKRGIEELQNKLSEIYDNYLIHIEPKYDYNQREKLFYQNLISIVKSCDDILNDVMSNVDVGNGIKTLLEQIQKSDNISSTQFKIKVVAENNINSGGSQNIGNYNLTINHSTPSKDKKDSRPKSFGHYPNRVLVGFDHEIKTLLDHLLKPHEVTRFVGIVGMGGSGKTTLAKHIYHHPEIQTRFDLRAWVCISQSWHKTSILNSIWRQVTQDPTAERMDYDQVVLQLYNCFLSSKSFLIILDDIWSIDAWTHIHQAFPNERLSAVVITTRKKVVPKGIGPTIPIVEPKQLDENGSYELFNKTASLLDKNTPHDLLSLGVEMIKKCKGLPLAIITLAGVLQMNTSLSSWERVSRRLTCNILEKKDASKEGVVKEVLALSYDELPRHLKPCSLYLHIFPEDEVIEAQKLIQMWVAERFVDEESMAEEYLDELAQRSIVEVVRTDYEGKVFEVRIHDLIRQMFVDIDQERPFLKNEVLRLVPRTTLYGDEQKSDESRKEVLNGYLHGSIHARSLIFRGFRDLKNLEMRPLFVKLKLLRVLILDGILLNKIPEEIGNLIHLRYLELSGNRYRFPRSIVNLENLLTLDIRNFDTHVHINLEKLKELRHLYLSTTISLHVSRGMLLGVLGLEKLKKLKTLWGAKGGEWMSLVMPELNDALHELYIWGIKTQTHLDAVFTTPSITSNCLHTLVLQWITSIHPSPQLRNMSILSKCTSLNKLELHGDIYRGTEMIFPPNLIHLKMMNIGANGQQVLNMISKSCPRLKILTFESKEYPDTQLVCSENSFPQLEKLVLRSIVNPKMWIIKRGAMQRLYGLTISNCSLYFLNPEGWDLVSKIPKLIFLRCNFERSFKELLKLVRNDWIDCIK